MFRAGNGAHDGPGFPGAVVLARSVLAADDRPMLLTNAPHAAPSSSAPLPEAVAVPEERISPPSPARMPEPLRGRALLAQLEQVAQRELATLAAQGGLAGPLGSAAMDPALIGLAWDLGLSGDAVVTTSPDPKHPAHRP